MRERLAQARRFNRTASCVGMGSVLIFALSDWLFQPAYASELLLFRLIGLGICILLFGVCCLESVERWHDPIMALGVFAFYFVTSYLVFNIFPVQIGGPYILPSALLCIAAVFSLIDLRLIFRILTALAIVGLALMQEAFYLPANSYNFPHYAAGLLIGYGGAYLMERYRRLNFFHDQAAQIERDKSERLLLNILPAPIAQRLRDEHKALADGFEEVTVLFADIVGFTPLSARLAPEKLLDHLNAIFSSFDDLAEKYALEKIKTIGDAYMVAGGLPLEQEAHTAQVARMALDISREIERYAQVMGEPLQLRMGMHVGPVVAGVIGRKKFIYDLWGDTVNIASRMESHGVAGKIQVTQAVYERLREDFDFEVRGPIAIKGRAEMQAYFLVGEKSA